ncbi:hypothetical protein EJ071_21590 [Mesorhizobium sp. M1B.F.Ca.ET.045.04.1.1]|nr:hypothetical protein EJ071_21590 [Mesorhizobium sp. M1B.F.Ca.ET.045.04.1.1]RWB21657.1 MAG: hypothetical protein EOQ40_09020 [Mesorhizobium sp.]TIS51858.1 MAG: hypothetical protein E5W96_00775 [Mesorhizobium sp.]
MPRARTCVTCSVSTCWNSALRRLDQAPAAWFSRGAAAHDFVILGRSKERSDAAQTLESIP